MVGDDFTKLDKSVDTVEDIIEECVQEQNESVEVLDLDDLRLDPVKSRRGRPKGTKKPFWNFSKKSTVTSKKRKATEKVEI